MICQRSPVPCPGRPVDPPWPAELRPALPHSAEQTCLAPHVSSLLTFHWPLTAIRDKSPPPVLSALESRVSAVGGPRQGYPDLAPGFPPSAISAISCTSDSRLGKKQSHLLPSSLSTHLQRIDISVVVCPGLASCLISYTLTCFRVESSPF